jgi:plastocyanin
MNLMKTFQRGGVIALVAVAMLAAQPVLAADVRVSIDNFTFAPQQITVKPGDTVIWTNRDDIPHTVVSKTLAFRSQALDDGDTFSFTFLAPGTYAYFCSLHPHMTGSIVVESGAPD